MAAPQVSEVHDGHVPVPDLPIRLAVAEPATALPTGPYEYSPKLDGWRAAVHVPSGVLQSRAGSDLAERFPAVLESAAALGRVVLDGELCAYRAGRLDFAALSYGPARRRAEGVVLVFMAFDLLGARGRDLRQWPLSRRRERLVEMIGAGVTGVQLMPSTLDVEVGRAWIGADQAAVGVEGAVAKPLGSRYPLRGGRAGWLKVRYFDVVDALVLGVTGSPSRPTALVLGQADRRGRVRAVGLSTTLSRPALVSLAGRLRLAKGGPQRVSGLIAGLHGGEDFTFWPVEPGVVVEARADRAFELGRFRHRLSVVRVRADF
ncbi:ATP-dependent DNA ligase [Amycolatopsis sp. NPDC004368]